MTMLYEFSTSVVIASFLDMTMLYEFSTSVVIAILLLLLTERYWSNANFMFSCSLLLRRFLTYQTNHPISYQLPLGLLLLSLSRGPKNGTKVYLMN